MITLCILLTCMYMPKWFFGEKYTVDCIFVHVDTHYDAERDLKRRRKAKEKKIKTFEEAAKKKKKKESA